MLNLRSLTQIRMNKIIGMVGRIPKGFIIHPKTMEKIHSELKEVNPDLPKADTIKTLYGMDVYRTKDIKKNQIKFIY